MSKKIDPKDIIDKADALLNEIEESTKKFVKNANKSLKSVNKSLSHLSDITEDLRYKRNKTRDKLEKEVLEYLKKSDK